MAARCRSISRTRLCDTAIAANAANPPLTQYLDVDFEMIHTDTAIDQPYFSEFRSGSKRGWAQASRPLALRRGPRTSHDAQGSQEPKFRRATLGFAACIKFADSLDQARGVPWR